MTLSKPPPDSHQRLYTSRSTERWRRYIDRVRGSPDRIFRHRAQARERTRKFREKKRIERENVGRDIQTGEDAASAADGDTGDGVAEERKGNDDTEKGN